MQLFIQELTNWIRDYIESFYSSDRDIQANIQLKEVHTQQVALNCRSLAENLGLPKNEQQLAEIIGLLHDIGRFKQYAVYQTFRDSISENHATLGLKEIAGLALLDKLSSTDRACLEFAIINHNTIAITDNGLERQKLFARIIRDADKLDIYRVLSPTIRPSDHQGYTQLYAEGLMAGKQCDNSFIRTADDRKLVRLTWLYDIHYGWTMKNIIKRGYVKELVDSLPDDPNIMQAVRTLQSYIRAKIEQDVDQEPFGR
ncbi:HD domain-containing protein [bacterium BFN5]|nr:HD domain-containing protein [bacterium BFN5]